MRLRVASLLAAVSAATLEDDVRQLQLSVNSANYTATFGEINGSCVYMSTAGTPYQIWNAGPGPLAIPGCCSAVIAQYVIALMQLGGWQAWPGVGCQSHYPTADACATSSTPSSVNYWSSNPAELTNATIPSFLYGKLPTLTALGASSALGCADSAKCFASVHNGQPDNFYLGTGRGILAAQCQSNETTSAGGMLLSCKIGSLDLGAVKGRCCQAAAILVADSMAQSGKTAVEFAAEGIDRCMAFQAGGKDSGCEQSGDLKGLAPTVVLVEAQDTKICGDGCIGDLRTALVGKTGLLASLLTTRLGVSGAHSDYCGECKWLSAFGGNPTGHAFGKKASQMHGSCCASFIDVQVVAYYAATAGLSGSYGGVPGASFCSSAYGCIDNTTVGNQYWADFGPGWNRSLPYPSSAYGVVPVFPAFALGLGAQCSHGGRCLRTILNEMATTATTIPMNGLSLESSALANVGVCASTAAAPGSCIIGNLNLGSLIGRCCEIAGVLAVQGMQAKSSSAEQMSAAGITDCWAGGLGVSHGLGADDWKTANGRNIGCESDGITPVAGVIAAAHAGLCAGCEGSLRSVVANNTHVLAVAIKEILGTDGHATLDYCATTTTSTSTSTITTTTTPVPPKVTKHITEVQFSVDMPTGMTTSQKDAAKAAITTSLHESFCGPISGAGKTFSSVAACKTGESGVVTKMTVTFAGALARRLRKLAAASADGQFEVSSTTAVSVTLVKDAMVGASTGGSPTLTPASVASTVTSAVSSALSASHPLHSFTATVSALDVPTTTVEVVNTPAPSSASGLSLLSALVVLVSSALFA